MSKPIHIFALVLYVTAAVVLQGQSSNKTPTAKPDYSQEAFVMEQYLRKVKLENDGTSLREDSARVRVQSDAGVRQYGLLTFSYPSATGVFEIDYVRVRKPDGTVVETPSENIQDMAAEITREAPFYSDLREKHIAVKGLGVGDVLEFAMHERVTKPLAPGQFWLDYTFTKNLILLDERLEVTLPRERAVKVKSPDYKPAVSEAGAYRTYTWATANLQRKDDKQSKQEEAKVSSEQLRGTFPQPDVLVTSFQTWEDVGRWYGGLQADRIKPSLEVRAKAAELTKGATDDEAKVRALYQYVSMQFRYIGVSFGIGRYQPHSASEVLANQYGDCKDKHTLLASLLDASGIKAFPALISSARDIDADVPSPTEFDHVITVIPQRNSLLWLDTTTEVGPFGYLVGRLRDKQALVIWDNKPAALVNTPADPPFPSTQTFNMDAKLSETGVLEGQSEFVTRGDLEALLRHAFRTVPLPQWKELAQRLSINFGFGGEVSDVTAGSTEKTEEPFHFGYKYTRKQFGDWANRRIVAPTPAINLPAPGDDDAPASVPLWFGPPSDIAFHSQVELPKGYSPELPDDIHVKYSFAAYDATYAFRDGLLITDRRMRTMTREVPAGEYTDYKKFYKTIQDDRDLFIQLSNRDSSAGNDSVMDRTLSAFKKSLLDLPDSSEKEAVRLEGEARNAAARGDQQGALSSLRQAVDQDPKFARAWIMLGTLLLSTNQIDDGMNAFHKAIAAEPTRPVVYKVLGYSLMGSSKLDEAIPVWQDLIKIAPGDVDGPSNLGSALFQLKRYAEAASVLEAAVKLRPERLNLHVQLASAYLRAGNDEKATAAFRKVSELNPDRETLNNASYEMAEADKQLALALEYGEKAVRAEEEASTKIELSKLRLEDLAHTQQLAAYWDTLGWVHNRMSNLEQAEKYLDAAWKISQHGVTASHLCHVYERLHKTQAAIQMCQFALYRIPLAGGPGMALGASEMEDARKRLAHLQALAAGSPKPQNLVATSDAINRMNVFKLPRLVPGTASAEFFVLLAANTGSGTFKIQDVKFISGSDKIKDTSKLLTSVNFNFPSPDKTPARFVRRGILGCYQYTGCSFVLLDPNTVRSLN